MCGGGKPRNTAQEAEDQRRRRVAINVTDINKLFFNSDGTRTADREAQFLDVENRVRERFLPEFQDQTKDATRELGFALSRRGLAGGSSQVDAEGRLADRVSQGERAIGEKVITARNEKQRLDQNLLSNLLNQANADANRDSLFNNLSQKQLASSASATELGIRDEVGNLFGDVGSLFKQINDRDSYQRGFNNSRQRFAGGRSAPKSFFGTDS